MGVAVNMTHYFLNESIVLSALLKPFKNKIMKKIVVIAVIFTILAAGAFVAYFMPETMPTEMKSITLNAEAVLITFSSMAGALWILLITLLSGKKSQRLA